MKGKWEGQYWFTDNVPNSMLNQLTKFELEIDTFNQSKFSGWVKDDLETGGTKGIGTVTGKIKGDRIQFVKQMPVRTYILGEDEKVEEEKPHRPIYYSGTINYKTNKINGTWRFKMGLGFIKGGVAFYRATKGEWNMKKTD